MSKTSWLESEASTSRPDHIWLEGGDDDNPALYFDEACKDADSVEYTRSDLVPAWHDRPTCKGMWICNEERYGWVVCLVKDMSKPRVSRRWYGPIPMEAAQ